MSRKIVGKTCGRCGVAIMTADDDLGIDSRVDPAPLSVAGEALAVLTGRELFTLVRVAGRWLLDRRTPEVSTQRLTAPLAALPPGGALALHRCGAGLPADEERPDWFALTAPPVFDPADALADQLGLPRPIRPDVDPPF